MSGSMSYADLYPEPAGRAPTGPLWNDPTNYGDPAAFTRLHITLLGADPSRWTTGVLGP
ncbi:hypothetical protein [Streptacidiphilus pinicola]|uniref:hypothetical protein n=1 Tax=Streptacidiphilus pinicola TaxID=2219663 RepID=UPI001402ADB1|nr:hypothetical protein [Streptacidiphilus pinicola]